MAGGRGAAARCQRPARGRGAAGGLLGALGEARGDSEQGMVLVVFETLDASVKQTPGIKHQTFVSDVFF